MKKHNIWYIKYIIVALAIVAFIAVFFISAFHTRDQYISLYNQAVELEEQGKYTEAYDVYFELYMRADDYKDIIDRMYAIDQDKKYNEAIKLEENGEYFNAMQIFIKMIDFKDSESHFDNCCNMYLENK